MKIQAFIKLILTAMPSWSAQDEPSRAEEVFRQFYVVSNDGISMMDFGIQGRPRPSPAGIEGGLELAARIDSHTLIVFTVIRKTEEEVFFEFLEVEDKRAIGSELSENKGQFSVTY